MLELLWRGLVIGIAATALMDLWTVVLNRVFGEPKANWAPVGRWFWHLRRGKVFHDSIAASEPYKHELALGWISHYAVGILYGIVFAFIVGDLWFENPTFLPAWIFGIATVAAGWFLLQPGLGIGWAASKAPNPWKVRGLNLAAHTVFALGLWGMALPL